MPTLFTQDEWRKQILPKLVKICAMENIGTGKRSTRASKEAIASCVRKYAKMLVEKKLAEKRAQIQSEIESLKSALGV